MLKIRRPLGRLIFNMGISIPGKTVFIIETAPRAKSRKRHATFNQQITFKSDQNLHMSRQLNDRDICKIVTWLDH